MWKQVLDALKQLVTLSQETQKNRSDIKSLQEEMKEVRSDIKDLTSAFERLAYEIHRPRILQQRTYRH